MKWIVDNWYIIFAAIGAAVCICYSAMKWINKPTQEQVENLKEWLKYAVIEAEKRLGSETGELKLRQVYDLAIAKFPWVATFISFETFSGYVDGALDWMKEKLSEDGAIARYIEK